MKLKITETHEAAAKELPKKHLAIHYSKTFFAHDDQNIHQRFKLIRKAFDVLDKIPLTQKILKLTASDKNLKTYFDFNRTSLEFMDPHAGNPGTSGLFYESGKVKVAANDFLIKNLKNSAIGTLAHEMCHFAMQLTFANDCKPYAIDDTVNEAKFSEIIEKCIPKIDKEKIVRWVFGYDENDWPAELIVRVAHMMAHYHDDQDKLKELKETFKDLFNYYDEVVAPKIQETQKMLEKLNENSTNIKFDDLTAAYKVKIHRSNVKFQGKVVKFNEIIAEKNSNIFQHLTSEQIRQILVDKKEIQIGKCQELKKGEFFYEREFSRCDDHKSYADETDFDEISTEAADKKMLILSEHAGVGKSTAFKHFSIKLKEKFPNFWISFVDLKKHTKIYEKFQKNIEKVLEILLEILAPTDQLEIEIFTKLFTENKLILLLDGVDEIAPNFNEFFMKFIENLQNSTKNELWIATRPQHRKELENKFGQTAYKFEPLNEDEIKNSISQALTHLERKKFTDDEAKEMSEEIVDGLK